MRDINKRLEECYKIVEDKGFEIVGIFLQGSQNYELAYENSDIDTKAIVLPKFNDFVLNKHPVSTTLVLDNNEHIDLKDIRLMFVDEYMLRNGYTEIEQIPKNIYYTGEEKIG